MDTLTETAKFFPRLKPGHGSLSEGKCNFSGCTLQKDHYQNPIELAKKFLIERSFLEVKKGD